MEVKKKCKGTGKAKDSGCSELNFSFKYGLCKQCFSDWLYNTPNGKEMLLKTTIRAKNEVKKTNQTKRKYIKWKDKDTGEMIKYVQFSIVNKYIKERDVLNYGRCISSNNAIVDAGHYYPTTETRLRFSPQNIFGQNDSDNRFKGGNIQAFKEGIINRFGALFFKELENLKKDCINWPKRDRIELIRIGVAYEWLHKNKIWVYKHSEFETWKNNINK